jgi:hypothetical protein
MSALDPKSDPRPGVGPSLAEDSGRPAQRTGLGVAVRVGVLGIAAWFVTVGVPALEGGRPALVDLVLMVLPLIALAGGVRGLGTASGEAGATSGLLLIGVPTLLATAMAGGSDPALSDRYGTALLLLGAIATLAYAAAAAHALGLPPHLRSTTTTKLPSAARARPGAPALRRLVLGTAVVGAVVVALVVPSLGSRAQYALAWGEAAEEGRVLTAIVGGAVGSVVLAVIVGPSLRAARPVGRPRGDGAALVASILVAVTGAMAWAMLRFVRH